MYKPQENGGIEWLDLTAQQKLDFLIEENTWLAGILFAQMGRQTTHAENLEVARSYVRSNYQELWMAVHGNFYAWPEEGLLRREVACRLKTARV